VRHHGSWKMNLRIVLLVLKWATLQTMPSKPVEIPCVEVKSFRLLIISKSLSLHTSPGQRAAPVRNWLTHIPRLITYVTIAAPLAESLGTQFIGQIRALVHFGSGPGWVQSDSKTHKLRGPAHTLRMF
jgi:hypothetical protein